MPHPSLEWVVLARILRPQGRKGELLADLLTDFPSRFAPGTEVYLAPAGFSGSTAEARMMKIDSTWLPHGRNEGRIVLSFEGVTSITEAERLSGLDLMVTETDRVSLTDGSIYVDSLIGCSVFDRDTLIGTVRDVQFLTTSDGRRRLEDAAPLLVMDLPSSEVLIPFAKDLLRSVDIDRKLIHMDLPEGLLDLNPVSTRDPSKAKRKTD